MSGTDTTHRVAMDADRAAAAFHILPGYPPEFELLLCCGPRLQDIRVDRVHSLLARDLDWDLVIRLAHWHHMLPLLYWSLARQDVAAPERIVEFLKDVFVHNVRTILAMTGELLTILQLLEERGIVAVPYKGPVLSDRVYGNIALRQCSDLDIVVRRGDVEAARQVLIERDYVPSVMVIGANHDFQVESRYSERFDRPESVVELHWAFTNKDVAFPLTLDDLIPRLAEHSVVGRNTRVFSPEDTLLILSVHGAKHSWDRLEWICGLAELLEGTPELDWDAVFTRAAQTRSSRRLYLGLALTHDLYGTQLPDAAVRRIRADGQMEELAAHVTLSMFDGRRNQAAAHAFGTLQHDLFHFKLADRAGDRLRYATYRMLNPSRPERWSTISIGKRAIPVHAVTRPFELLGKGIKLSWRRARERLRKDGTR